MERSKNKQERLLPSKLTTTAASATLDFLATDPRRWGTADAEIKVPLCSQPRAVQILAH